MRRVFLTQALSFVQNVFPENTSHSLTGCPGAALLLSLPAVRSIAGTRFPKLHHNSPFLELLPIAHQSRKGI